MSIEGSTDRTAETRARLLDLIDSLPAGERIPSERELAERWGVARMTLRKAIDRLVLDSLLERRHRRGTYTCRPRVPRHLTISSFTEEMTRRGVQASSRMLALKRTRASVEVSRRLRVPEGEPVIRFTRLRLGDGEPVAIETNYVPAVLFPGLTEADLDGSWYAVMSRRYGIDIIAGTAQVQPALPDERTAELLGIPPGQPCFSILTVVRDRNGRVVEYGDSVYRGDYYTITVELLPTVEARGAPRPPH
ncbi:GntR family transcriptional regulator [Sphaerisporangium krabiense]|uniref:GntR family transcriptional regulator n=1 Tax=Sphaerisporangium krabiense TaxID=763782 RepID=A0A7W9DP83_9ACTN|nr:GntR family transcriptional regulator [Sphaerisporangium krabiense]MBB5626181.1 GntR family transcriptional regulator [Sphaerisporangium krabiense]GII66152.1 GntR family transcriptional regulator [Sphaerisporangium krabiense]